MSTLDRMRETIRHLAELINNAQQILTNNPAVTELHREIINQALIVQREFPPDLLGGR